MWRWTLYLIQENSVWCLFQHSAELPFSAQSEGAPSVTALTPLTPQHDEGACWFPTEVYQSSIILTHWGRLEVNHTSNTAYTWDNYSLNDNVSASGQVKAGDMPPPLQLCFVRLLTSGISITDSIADAAEPSCCVR
jgi:hypothetical protein